MKRYEDIIHLPRPELKRHLRMPKESRASQFGAFRALSGHEAAVAETARLTEQGPDITEHVAFILNTKIRILQEHLAENPNVTVTYFKPDKKKSGGAYRTVTGAVKKLDLYERKLILADRTEIPFSMIAELESEWFDCLDGFYE